MDQYGWIRDLAWKLLGSAGVIASAAASLLLKRFLKSRDEHDKRIEDRLTKLEENTVTREELANAVTTIREEHEHMREDRRVMHEDNKQQGRRIESKVDALVADMTQLKVDVAGIKGAQEQQRQYSGSGLRR